MELDEIVDKYRALKPQARFLIPVVVALIPAINMWLRTGDALETRKATVEGEYQTEHQNFEDARQKAAELPALEAKLSEIEVELTKAKEFLPDKIEIDSILRVIGTLEKELDVTMVKFTPGAEVNGSNGLEYRELPVDIQMRGTFVNTMRFMDRLVHLQNLTHMRNIQFLAPEIPFEERKKAEADGTASSARRVESQAKLILFKGV